MKLLLISLSVVFCFSCSKDTPTLDTSLHTEKLVYNVKGKEDLIISIKWRFISYSVVKASSKVDNLGRVKVKGGFKLDFVNRATMNVAVDEKKFVFYDKEDFKIAEYNDHKKIKIAGYRSNSHSGNFDIYLDNVDLTNDIERLALEIRAYRDD